MFNMTIVFDWNQFKIFNSLLYGIIQLSAGIEYIRTISLTEMSDGLS